MLSPKGFIDKLSDHLQKHNSLEKLLQQLQTNFALTACIGVEVEFYLSKNIDPLELETLLCIAVKKEKGEHQYEIDLPPTTNIIDYIDKINSTKSKIQNIVKKLNGTADFTSKPFLTDYGNSMHFHVNFLEPTDYVKHAQSICHYMLDSFLVFMPIATDYSRLDKHFMAPTNVSFGNNNRTVAVRMPDLVPKRLEHRLSSPLTDPYIAIFTILNSIMLGLESRSQINNLDMIYGNAFDQQYNLVSLPRSLSEALELFKLEFYVECRQQGKSTIESLLQIIKNS
jgi:glutamine synthetase